MCVCSCVSNPPPTCFQPETSREVTRRISNLHSQIPNAGLQRSRSGGRWPPDEPRWGILEQYPSRQRLKREDVGAALLSSTPRKSSAVSRETSRRGFIFTKDCISEGLFMARCHVDLSSVPTHAEHYPPTLRGVHTRIYHKCILELGVYVSQLPSDLPTTLLHPTPPYSPQMFFSAFSFIGT